MYLLINEDSPAKLPNAAVKVGDVILTGKFKNKRCVIKGFGVDKNNQPIVHTDKGDVPLYKFRIERLMPKKEVPVKE